MKVVWQDHAKTEFRDAVRYYRSHAGELVARDFSDETRRATQRLREQPRLGIRLGGEIRRFPMHGYPYHLIYRLTADTVIIVAIAHQSRRPGYWAGRR